LEAMRRQRGMTRRTLNDVRVRTLALEGNNVRVSGGDGENSREEGQTDVHIVVV
jgi:hypothetical protein